MSIFRIYSEKKTKFAVEAQSMLHDIKTTLKFNINNIRIINRYDVEKLIDEDLNLAINTVFSEPTVDIVYRELPKLTNDERIFAVEFLPSQFDQRADSCEQCIQILRQGIKCRVRTARVYIIDGTLTDKEFEKLKSYVINPVDSRETSLAEINAFDTNYVIPTTVAVLEDFIDLNERELYALVDKFGLAMDYDDIKFCQDYFRNKEHRNPTITEIRMIDTYWSDHCRHTTFLTNIQNVNISTTYIKETYDMYLNVRNELGILDKPITLMDLGTIAAKKLKTDGILKDLDENAETNACSVKIKVDIDDQIKEDWILMFKNETHNHPTEIEPFGGAATCLGGAIRDPLSGRSYVYQAMRITGAANPLVPIEDTIIGKFPQRKITLSAANGYSSYGNQIGLSTGHVFEIYHPGYVAKRMEIGAVIGAAPVENIRREIPVAGDVVILLGGKTGRDGCGGATGSSKPHTLKSIENCSTEVQKGNPLEERKIQRLFRNPDVTKMIKRCNDLGAGGLSVAISELTDGLIVNLNAVPRKYDGLDGTEIAISESQERMAVVIANADMDKFIAEAKKENLEATYVADVVSDPRLKMNWNDKTIVDLSREFLNSNGAKKYTDVLVEAPQKLDDDSIVDTAEEWTKLMSRLNICSQKGIIEKFDSTIGAGTVLMPFGGIYQTTPSQVMAAKIPVLKGETNTCSLMSWGYNPDFSSKSPYHGAMIAVIESVAKIVAASGTYKKCWLTFQEYFECTHNTPKRWGKPLAALLGAFKAQLELGCGSIGGKDSMSGTFGDINVPPTLISFAVSITKANKIISAEFKKIGSTVIYIESFYDENCLPVFDSIKSVFEKVEDIISSGRAISIWTIGYGGIAEGIAKMCFGNKIGFKFTSKITADKLYKPCYGSFIIELIGKALDDEMVIGKTVKNYKISTFDYTINLDILQRAWESKLEPVFPCHIETTNDIPLTYTYKNERKLTSFEKFAKPRVLIPVFPGTNCEYDTERAFVKAGSVVEIVIIHNMFTDDIKQSIDYFEKAIKQSQIIMIPGGFSGGDEPDGSGKFITVFFRNPKIKDSVHNFIKNRDGLMLGICNGFQALIKLGLVPYGEIVDINDNSPTLTFNKINRHQSMMVNTRIASNKSPWLYGTKVGDIHCIPISHSEGRFVASINLIQQFANNGQIATQYVDLNGFPTMDIRYNPNTSIEAIEGITSPDGRIFGKMGHSERKGSFICKNVDGNKDQKIFESGVAYFK